MSVTPTSSRHIDDMVYSASDAGLPDDDQNIHHVRRSWTTSATQSQSPSTDDSPSGSSGIHKLTHALAHLPSKLSNSIHRSSEQMHDFVDMWHEVSADLSDTQRHPELEMDATLRRNNELSDRETAFMEARKRHVIETKALQRFLGLPLDTEVHPDDIPIVAIGGSGGGYRANLGYLALMESMQETPGLWDLVFYAAGVSGSCWSLAGLYTIGRGSAAHTLQHFSQTSEHHPLSSKAIERVAQSPRGVYFQLGPILQKIRVGSVEWTPLDLYATLTTTHILLSRTDPFTGAMAFVDTEEVDAGKPVSGDTAEPEKEEKKQEVDREKHEVELRLDQAWFRWTSIAESAGIDKGLQPLPIFTACRHERPWRDWKSKTDPFDEIDHASKEHDRADAWWQWFEITPYEFGCDELEGWIPTWAFGRSFNEGQSDPKNRIPERSLSLLLGVCTSAPAGPLSAWIDTLARNLPQNSFGKTIKQWGTDWVKRNPKSAEELVNHHPIHAVNEPNPFFGAEKKVGRGQGFENSPRVHLVDSGMSNNLPTFVFFRPHRHTDIAILGDYSSDVQKGAALDRIHAGGLERSLDIQPRQRLEALSPHPTEQDEEGKPRPKQLSADETESRFRGRYAEVLDATPTAVKDMMAWQQRKAAGELKEWELDNFEMGDDGLIYNDKHVPLAQNEAVLVYHPLLPNKVQPAYDPSTAQFSSSYNLRWTAEQVGMIRKTANANFKDSLDTIRAVFKEVYEKKRDIRLRRGRST